MLSAHGWPSRALQRDISLELALGRGEGDAQLSYATSL
jgi:hypothetical protein